MGNPVTTKDQRPDRASTAERRRRTAGGARVRKEENRSRLSLRTGVCMLLATVILTMGTYVLSTPKDQAPVVEPPLPEDAGTEPVRTSPASPDAASPSGGSQDASPASPSGGGQDASPDAAQTGPEQPPSGEEGVPASGGAAAAEPEPTEKEKELDHLVQVVLDNIIAEDMTKLEQARAVFDFTRTKISYTGDSDKSDWLSGAYEGLTTRKGDCFTYYAVSRALLTALGIDNLEVQRVGGPTSHYWNLVNCGDGWYHFDATPRSSKMPAFVSFMFTDAEAADYTARAGREYYTFDGSLYPERATGEPGENA